MYMASVSLGDSVEDLNSERIQRAKGYDVIVYTRRTGKKVDKDCSYKSKITSVVGRENEISPPTDATGVSAAQTDVVEPSLEAPVLHELPCASQNEVDDVNQQSEKPCNNAKSVDGIVQENGSKLTVDGNSFREPLSVASSGDFIRFKLGMRSSAVEIKDLNQKLENYIESIRSMFKLIETKECQLYGSDVQLSNDNVATTNGSLISAEAPPTTADRTVLLNVRPESGPILSRAAGLARVNSDIGVPRNLEPVPYNRQLSVSVMDSNRAGDFFDKEKRTPKANQLYRNSEFLLGKDRLPSDSNKRTKSGNKKKYGGDAERAFRFGLRVDKVRKKVFRSCANLLQRLMKHKYSWIFNQPVNAQELGLFDYHDIIKHPMDLGTIKDRLSRNWYNSPKEFADDVRLVFHNAMTYNPKGQDAHTMAEELLRIFEERWAVVEIEYNDYWKYHFYKDGPFPTPTSQKLSARSYYNSSSAPSVAGYHLPHPVRTPAPKRPKAKDPNKRDMTHEEKQRLSKKLQDLPGDKLDAIVQIIKRRNTALSQHDDEIEVDIDSVDPETLWELDRFVSNYKKSLSKSKRRAELALEARSRNPNEKAPLAKPTPEITRIQTETGAPGKSVKTPEGDKKSESSSSSDSGSSSSDSDSESSSGDGSDAGGTDVVN